MLLEDCKKQPEYIERQRREKEEYIKEAEERYRSELATKKEAENAEENRKRKGQKEDNTENSKNNDFKFLKSKIRKNK